MVRKYIQYSMVGLLTLSGASLTQGTLAADANGQFAVRGAGLITCEIYNHERKAQSEVYLITAAWVDGYITATNQYLSDTYDVMSFETTELLAAFLDEHCSEHPRDRVFPVIKSLIAQLYDDRLRMRATKTEIAVGERTTSLYVEVLRRVQSKLASAGFYKGQIDGHFGQSTIEAVKAFQKSIEFRPTGFPDQTTLWRLLRAP